MISQSNIKPKYIELKYIENKYCYYYLRKNIKEITNDKNEIIKENNQTIYTYDEVILKIINRENIEEDIVNNFDKYFNFASQQEKIQQIKEQSEKRIYQLNEGGLVNVETISDSCAMLLTNLMMEVEILKNEIETLKGSASK